MSRILFSVQANTPHMPWQQGNESVLLQYTDTDRDTSCCRKTNTPRTQPATKLNFSVCSSSCLPSKLQSVRTLASLDFRIWALNRALPLRIFWVTNTPIKHGVERNYPGSKSFRKFEPLRTNFQANVHDARVQRMFFRCCFLIS